MSRRDSYGKTEALPTLYILAKLYVHCSKLLNKTLEGLHASFDDLETLHFYTNILLERAKITFAELEKVKTERDLQYNSIYKCSEHLSEADLLSFLVVKALRLKNIYLQTHQIDHDSAVDFVLYLRMYQTLAFERLTLPV